MKDGIKTRKNKIKTVIPVPALLLGLVFGIFLGLVFGFVSNTLLKKGISTDYILFFPYFSHIAIFLVLLKRFMKGMFKEITNVTFFIISLSISYSIFFDLTTHFFNKQIWYGFGLINGLIGFGGFGYPIPLFSLIWVLFSHALLFGFSNSVACYILTKDIKDIKMRLVVFCVCIWFLSLATVSYIPIYFPHGIPA